MPDLILGWTNTLLALTFKGNFSAPSSNEYLCLHTCVQALCYFLTKSAFEDALPI